MWYEVHTMNLIIHFVIHLTDNLLAILKKLATVEFGNWLITHFNLGGLHREMPTERCLIWNLFRIWKFEIEFEQFKLYTQIKTLYKLYSNEVLETHKLVSALLT